MKNTTSKMSHAHLRAQNNKKGPSVRVGSSAWLGLISSDEMGMSFHVESNGKPRLQITRSEEINLCDCIPDDNQLRWLRDKIDAYLKSKQKTPKNLTSKPVQG